MNQVPKPGCGTTDYIAQISGAQSRVAGKQKKTLLNSAPEPPKFGQNYKDHDLKYGSALLSGSDSPKRGALLGSLAPLDYISQRA